MKVIIQIETSLNNLIKRMAINFNNNKIKYLIWKISYKCLKTGKNKYKNTKVNKQASNKYNQSNNNKIYKPYKLLINNK